MRSLDVCGVTFRNDSRPSARSRSGTRARRTSPPAASWALFANDAGAVSLVATGTLPEAPSGSALEGWTVELATADYGRDGLVLRVDDDGDGVGTVGECDENDNESEYGDVFCP